MIRTVDERDDKWVIHSETLKGKVFLHDLPTVTTMEALDEVIGGSDGAIVRFGDHVLVAVARFDGIFSVVYDFVDSRDAYIDSPIEIRFVDDDVYGDTGHALEAAMKWCRDYR